MEVSTLVSQMNETLSTIHNTIASLNTAEHDARLDELEQEREKHLQALHTAFSDESSAISQKRKAEREEIAEQRRKEDEERERRRRLEDEELEAKARAEDEERDGDLREHTKEVEEKTDHLMAQVEEEAQRMLEEGKERLRVLEEKRKELNRLIDEQLQMPLPPPPTRARRSFRAGNVAPAVAIESKRLEPPVEAEQPMSNPIVKAHEDDSDRNGVHEDETLPRTTYSPEPVEMSLAVPDIVAKAHEDTTTVGEEDGIAPAVAGTRVEAEGVDDDVHVSRSYPTEQEEEEEEMDDEEQLSIAEMPVLSRCNSRDPSAEMHAQSAAAEYENDSVRSDYSEEEDQVASSDNTHEAFAVEHEISPSMEPIQEEEPTSAFEDVREKDASYEHDDDLREQQPAALSPDMHPQVTAAEDEGDMETSQLPNHEPVTSDGVHSQASVTEGGDASLDKGHLGEQELTVYSADTLQQPAPAEQEEASLHHDQPTEEEPVTRLRSDSAELAWWEQKRLHELSEASDTAEKVQEQAEGIEADEAVPDTLEQTAVEVDKEPFIAAEELPAVPHDLDHNRDESEAHVSRGGHEVRYTDDDTKEVHSVESDPHSMSESQETESVDGSVGAKEDWPLKDDEVNVDSTDGVRGAESPALTVNTDVADKDGLELAPATVEYMQHGQVSPTSTTDNNNIPTASVSTPVANIEFISRMLNDELDMVETSPVDILSVGSPFDGDSSFDSGHQHSQLTADTSVSNVEEQDYHDHGRDSASEYDEGDDHVNAKSLSDELQGQDDEGVHEEVAHQPGVHADSGDYVVEVLREATPAAGHSADSGVRGEDHIDNNIEASEVVNPPVVEQERETSVHGHDEFDADAVEESHVPASSYEHELALESHTGDDTVSEDRQELAEEDMHVEAELQAHLQEQRLLHADEAESFAGEERHHTLHEDNHGMSQEEDEHDYLRDKDAHPNSAVIQEEEVVQVSHATATDRDGQRNSTGDVVDGYFDHEAHDASHSEEIPHSAGHLMPLATSNTDAESQAFFTPLASAEFRSPTTAEEAPGQDIDRHTASTLNDHVDESHPVVTNITPSNEASYNEDPTTGVGLHRTSTNGDSCVDEQDSNNGYESNQHELELEDGYSTTVHGQDHLFDDDHSDDSIDHKDTTPTDEAVGHDPFAQDYGHQEDIHDPGLQEYAEPSAEEDNIGNDGHYTYEPDTPVAAEVMFPADHDAHDVPASRKGSWADRVEQHRHVEEGVEHSSPEASRAAEADHPYKDDHDHDQGHVQGHEQPVEIPTASDTDHQEQENPHPTPSTISKGLAASRHNPERPQTPDQSTHHHHTDSTPDMDDSPEDSFAPRDVTNIPWHSRTESTPLSLRSASTLSSSPSSPVHASLLPDNHEPVIRDSWPVPGNGSSPFRGMSSVTGRPRTDSHMTDWSVENTNGNTVKGGLGASPMRLWQRREQDGEFERQRPVSVVEISTSNREDAPAATSNSAGGRNSVGGSLFQRMRSVFEQGGGGAQSQSGVGSGSQGGSPVSGGVRSRAGSNLFVRGGGGDAQQGNSKVVVGSRGGEGLVRPGDVAGAYDGGEYGYGYGYGEEEDREGEGSSLLNGDGMRNGGYEGRVEGRNGN